MNLYGFVQNDSLRTFDADGRASSSSQLSEFQTGLASGKAAFLKALQALCPSAYTSITLDTKPKCPQLCTRESCLAQAQDLADALAAAYQTVFTKQFNMQGKIVGGWDGNETANQAPLHGELAQDFDKGYGLKCIGWTDLTTDKFFEAIRPYRKDGKQCFRGAQVGKPDDRYSEQNHSWVVIYGPSRKGLGSTSIKSGDYDVVIDPWPSGGKQIINPNPYDPRRFDLPILW